jgi:hypothetical protein
MNKQDVAKLQELTLLLDLAYIHHFKEGEAKYKSAEATVRLEFGNFWYRKANPTSSPEAPQIESVVIYSSVFSANRVNYFDSLDEALSVVQTWYENARAPQQ